MELQQQVGPAELFDCLNDLHVPAAATPTTTATTYRGNNGCKSCGRFSNRESG